MIQIIDKEKCCGCAACFNACPKNCITMRSDEEGFLYPFVDETICNDCGICEKVCPELHPVKESIVEQKAFLVQHKNGNIRKESTSGGAFTAISEYVIKQGGVVFGVAYDKNFHVIHKFVENTEDLRFFRNSKYVQSIVGDTFSQAKEFLKLGRLVCFSGTPCQIEGLKKYLNKEYVNLITVDIVCRAVPSPLVWDKYLSFQGVNSKNTNNILFRDKKYFGYKYSVMSIYNQNNKEKYHDGIDTDVMLRAFFSNVCDRPSCYSCSFKKRYRISDFTLWDCFDVAKFSKKLDDDKGTTRILTHTEKANQILEKISDKVIIERIDVELAIAGVREMIKSVPTNPKREVFFKDLSVLEPSVFFRKYFPNNIRARLEKNARIVSYKLGVYQLMKNIVKSIYQNKSNQKK